MIEIKAWFSDWQIVSEEKALKFVTRLKNGMMCKEKNEWIDKNHLRGITCEDLERRAKR